MAFSFTEWLKKFEQNTRSRIQDGTEAQDLAEGLLDVWKKAVTGGRPDVEDYKAMVNIVSDYLILERCPMTVETGALVLYGWFNLIETTGLLPSEFAQYACLLAEVLPGKMMPVMQVMVGKVLEDCVDPANSIRLTPVLFNRLNQVLQATGQPRLQSGDQRIVDGFAFAKGNPV